MPLFFEGMAEFAAFLPKAVLFEIAADVEARGLVAHELTEDIRHTIGNESLLPPPLAASTQAERVEQGFSSNETLLRTGDLQDSIAWDHESRRKTVVGSTDEKAVWHEFGPTNGRFPARSFMASTAIRENPKLFAIYCEAFMRIFGSAQDTLFPLL